MDKKITRLQKIINIKFTNLELLTKCITHKSYNNEVNNEKLVNLILIIFCKRVIFLSII